MNGIRSRDMLTRPECLSLPLVMTSPGLHPGPFYPIRVSVLVPLTHGAIIHVGQSWFTYTYALRTADLSRA
jgi:hypothetical protein